MAKKEFLRGMEAGAKPFEDKFRQVEQAVNTVHKKVNERLEGVRDAVNIMADDLSAMQKKELYDLNTQFDLKQLEDYDKELLLAGLYTLASMNDSTSGLTVHQQSFVRSVQRYVGAKTPQTSVDLSIALENVESISVQKALLQVFMEFLFLENENNSFFDDYAELFDFFSVKKKDVGIILEQIHTIYRTTGTEGIAEKYGYVPAMHQDKLVDSKDKPVLRIVIIGHIDHGKTSLASAITKVLSQRYDLGEEIPYVKIDTEEFFVKCETMKRRYELTDLPTHDHYIEYMGEHIAKSELPEKDGAVLVVAGTDSTMSQTRKQLSMIRNLGLKYIVVFMSKCDIVNDTEMLDLVEIEIRDMLDEYGFSYHGTPIILGSATEALKDPSGKWGDTVIELLDALDSTIPTPENNIEHTPKKVVTENQYIMKMEVDDVFSIIGRGTVATGKIALGSLNINDTVTIVSAKTGTLKETVVTAVEMFHKTFDFANEGDSVGLLLRGIQGNEVSKGDLIVKML